MSDQNAAKAPGAISRRAFGVAAGATALFPAVSLAQDPSGNSAALTAFLDDAHEARLQRNPESLTSLGRKEHYGELDDRSEANADRELAIRRRSVEQMKDRFNPANLSDDARLSFEVWDLELARAERSREWRRHRYVFSRGGPHAGFPNFMINEHRVDEPSDMDDYISRVSKFGGALDQLMVRARAAAADGIRMPRFTHDQSLDEIGRILRGAPFGEGPDSPLFADAKTKIAALKTAGKIDERRADALTRRAAEAMTGKMKPAYDRLSAWLRAEKEKAGPVAQGVWALPNGEAYYNASLYLQTTTDMTAEQIHQLGLSEVARIRGEMETVKARTGFTGSLADFFVFMRTERRFLLPNTDEGRAQYLATAQRYLDAMKARMPQFFGLLPKADLVVRRVEAFREQPGAAQHYMAAALDGSRPGIFYAHLSDMNAMPTYQLEAIAHHEGLPGHHLQISIARELKDVAKFRTQLGYTAFSEGWGLYAEAFPKELGFYEDPYSDFGRLSTEIWRAIRLVVDTGIHAKHWTQQQAVDYFLANSPQPEGAIRSEIERYILGPGQATCYKIGMLRIQGLRNEARSALGPRFDYRPFHDQVLGGGALPMPVLEAKVRRWIAATRTA